MRNEVPRKVLQAVPVPDYLLKEQKANKKALVYGGLTAIGLLGLRTLSQVWADPQQFASKVLIAKAYADQLLGGAQMLPTPSNLNSPGLLTLDTVAGIGIPIAIAGVVGAGTALNSTIHKEENIRKAIIARGDIEHPLGLIGHTVVLGQEMSFMNEMLTDIQKADHTDPFLISKVGPSQFDPYTHKRDGEPATRYWKSTVDPYDDKILTIADIDNSLRMVVSMTQTDNLILANQGETGLPLADVGNAIATAYRLKPDLQTLLIVPSENVIDAGFFETLAQNGVDIKNVWTVVVDNLLKTALEEKMHALNIPAFDLNAGEYDNKYQQFLERSGIPISTESAYQIIYEKDDSKVLWKAREARGKGKIPLAIFDTAVQVSEAKGKNRQNEIEYICIEELIRGATREFVKDTKPEIRDYSFNITSAQKALVYNGLEPLLVQKSAAINIIRSAIQGMGEEEFFKLFDQIEFAEIKDGQHIHKASARETSYRMHERFFTHAETTVSGQHDFTTTRRNSSIVRKSLLRNPVEKLTVQEVLERYFGAKIVDKKTIRDFNAIIHSLYVLGYVYKDGKEYVRYPFKNSVVKDMFRELGILDEREE